MNAFILALFQRKHKLKSTTLFQVLIGRQTSSVLCYAYFNDLLPYFRSFPELSENDFQQRLQTLTKQGWLQAVPLEPHYYEIITKKPKEETPTFSHLNYFRFGKKEKEVWRLIQLLVQVASYLGKSKEYLPIESSPYSLARMRYFVRQHKKVLRATIYQELTVLLQALEKEQADFLSQSFTGHQQNGSAFFQLLPEAYQAFPQDKFYVSNSLHAFFSELEQHQEFLLYQFVADLFAENRNKSAVLSIQRFKEGMTLAQISQQRRLKQGTLHDHMIEWAISDEQFPFQAFLSAEHYARLQQLPANSWQYPYRTLHLPPEISFFELRLYQIQEKRGTKC